MSSSTSVPQLSPEARGATRLGIFGGSFDPVHAGHLHVARSARSRFELDHVVFIPAARPPHKPGRVLATGADRVAMLELALADEAGVSLWGVELEREGPSYTIDTVRSLIETRGHPGGLWLLLGTDNLEGLPEWAEAAELLDSVQPAVILRGGYTLEAFAALETLSHQLSAGHVQKLWSGLCRSDPVAISSTELREWAAAGQGPAPEMLHPEVAAYIRERELYR